MKCDILGAGISNTPLIKYLLSEGNEITVRDKKPFDKLSDEVKSYEGRVKFVCGEDYLDDLDGEMIFRTPGIRPDEGGIPKAVERGAVLTSEMERFFEICPCEIIGITGSDGKTTTTTLISELLKAQYGEEHVFVGGNIGAPLLPRVKDMKKGDFAVVELSSFQLMTMKKCPHVAVITNITPNHLNWHTGMDEYRWAKENIFRNMKKGDRIVLNSRDELSKEASKLVPDGVEKLFFVNDGTKEENGVICREGKPILNVSDILIPGRHNIENYEGVIAAIGDRVDPEIIVHTAKTFGGVKHRIQLVRVKDGVKYYNSSIDSTPTRTSAALSALDGNLIPICGGRDKHLPLDPLVDSIEKKAKAVVLTGEAMELINNALVEASKTRKMPPIYCEPDFEKAVKKASEIANNGDIVILSPACTSFDRFNNFEERGDLFIKLVMEL